MIYQAISRVNRLRNQRENRLSNQHSINHFKAITDNITPSKRERERERATRLDAV